MNPFSLELHDAHLLGVSLDPVRRTVTLTVGAYEEPSASERVKLQIRFEHVESVNLSADLTSLADNFKAGNINYWNPAVSPQCTHLHLADGYIVVSAQTIVVTRIGDAT